MEDIERYTNHIPLHPEEAVYEGGIEDVTTAPQSATRYNHAYDRLCNLPVLTC